MSVIPVKLQCFSGYLHNFFTVKCPSLRWNYSFLSGYLSEYLRRKSGILIARKITLIIPSFLKSVEGLSAEFNPAD